jgi:hypothetical protein
MMNDESYQHDFNALFRSYTEAIDFGSNMMMMMMIMM